MQAYFDLIRSLVTPTSTDPPPAPRVDDPLGYAALVRLQQVGPVAHAFEPLRARLGADRFDALVEAFRVAHPPRDPLPSRWMRAFADHLAAQPDVDDAARELADFLALRIDLLIAPDPAPDRPSVGELRAYAHDPRDALRGRVGRPCTVLLFRGPDGSLRAVDVDADAVAAWGLSRGETTRADLAGLGIDDARIARGEAALNQAKVDVAPAGFARM